MKYGWEIADEVERHVEGVADIQYVPMPVVQKLLDILGDYANGEVMINKLHNKEFVTTLAGRAINEFKAWQQQGRK